MTAFETLATLSDPSHLTLREPVPASGGRECRVIVLLEEGIAEPAAPVLAKKRGLWVVRGDDADEAEHALERLREERLAALAG